MTYYKFLPLVFYILILKGFPRTVPQAQALYEKEPLDVVLNLNIPDYIIIDRIKGRWTHAPSGRIYHTEFNPPKVPVCCSLVDKCLV
jgi:nucleoside-triphosphate--adenylate kinase